MRKIGEVLRLKAAGLHIREIARRPASQDNGLRVPGTSPGGHGELAAAGGFGRSRGGGAPVLHYAAFDTWPSALGRLVACPMLRAMAGASPPRLALNSSSAASRCCSS